MLTGTLDDFTLADVLRLVAGARRSGDLAVTRDGGAGTLCFRDGAVTRAVPRYDRRNAPVSPTGAVEDLTFDLMRWGRGEFTWAPGNSGPAAPEAAVAVDDLLREVTRRLDELAEIQTLVPSEEAVLTMAPQPPDGAVEINITPAEWRVLVLVDGRRTVSDVAVAAGLDDLEAMKLLFALAAAGLVTATPAALDDTLPSRGVSDTTDMTDVSDVSDAALEEGHTAEPDPFLAELAMEPASPSDAVPAATPEAPAVDRSTAARELAGLFDDVVAPPGFERMTAASRPTPPAAPRRVEDDDQVTRGLVSRLIDGVKGL